MVQIHIGTSGWSYNHWKGDFYPKTVRVKDWLAHYAQYFDTTEINGSFYRLPSEKTVLTWQSIVENNFLFCPKMSRFLTHMKKLRDPEEPLERFFSVFSAMKQIGPVLFQLPAILKFNYNICDHLFRLLQGQYKNYEFVLEARHPTWLEDDALTLLAKYEIGFVIAQSGNRFPYAEMATTKNIYVRFHGPQELYASSYSDTELKYFAKKFRAWSKDGHQIWAFFNNDIHGYAPKDALRLKKFCEV